jgi:hypothetical protein
MLMTSPVIQNQTWTTANMTTQGYSAKNPYSVSFPASQTTYMGANNATGTSVVQNRCGTLGY